jgi:protease-4
MTMSADEIVDRRRLRRKLAFWRVAAVIVAVVAVVALIASAGGGDAVRSFTPQIARISITGFISEDRKQLQLIERLAEEQSVKGVIVSINSAGGSTVGGEALYQAIRKLAEKKPTVAQMGTVAASAAYMAALATDHIVARRTTLTASIGVLMQYPELSQLLDKLGVKVEEIKSAPLKAEPSPFHPSTEEARAVAAGVIADSFQWFVDIVSERRGLPRERAVSLADGRIMTGGQALNARLIDEIGGEEAARAWLEEKRGVAKDLPIRDWSPRNVAGFPFSEAVVLWIARELGVMPDAVRGLGLERLLPDPFNLDGLRSVWQGQLDPREGEEAYR